MDSLFLFQFLFFYLLHSTPLPQTSQQTSQLHSTTTNFFSSKYHSSTTTTVFSFFLTTTPMALCSRICATPTTVVTCTRVFVTPIFPKTLAMPKTSMISGTRLVFFSTHATAPMPFRSNITTINFTIGTTCSTST